jgi:hypothetical protein
VDKLRSKNSYKLLIIFIKYAPFIGLVVEICYSITAYLSYNGIIFTFISGFSISSIVLLYIASYVFKYCYLYRLSLHAISLVNIIAMYDSFIGIPISDLNILRIYLIILLCGIIAFVLFKKKSRTRH